MQGRAATDYCGVPASVATPSEGAPISKLLVPEPEFLEKLYAIEREFIAGVDEKLAPFLKNYRDLVGADASDDIRTRNRDAILRIHHASLLGASSEVLYETFAELVWPLHNELERRAAAVEQGSAATKEALRRAADEIVSLRKARIAAGRARPGDENLNEVSEAVKAMVTLAQPETQKISRSAAPPPEG